MQAERLLQLITAEVETRFGHAVMRRALDASIQKQKLPTAQWSFATDYALHVQDAVREFAALLTQAKIGPHKKINGKAWLWILGETLKFASALVNWEGGAGTFVAISLGIKGKNPTHKVPPAVRTSFVAELEQFVPGFKIEANNAITLRCALFDRPAAAPSSDNITRALIARIKGDNPGISQLQICEKADSLRIPVLERWRRTDDQTWVGAYRRRKNAVKTFLSKIKPSPSSERPSSRRFPSPPLGSH